MHEPSFSHSRPRLGTSAVPPSGPHAANPLHAFVVHDQPAACSSAVTRRYHSARTAWPRAMTSSVSASSSSAPHGALRCVDRCCPSTRHTRRSIRPASPAHGRCTAGAVRAQKFPLRRLLRISLSNVRSEIARRSRRFSFSRSFIAALIRLQTTILLAPTVVGLLADCDAPACLGSRAARPSMISTSRSLPMISSGLCSSQAFVVPSLVQTVIVDGPLRRGQLTGCDVQILAMYS